MDWTSWETWATVAAVVAFGVCVFATAGWCAVAGLGAAAIAARAKAGEFGSAEFGKYFLYYGIINLAGAGVGKGAGMLLERLGFAGARVGRHALPNLYNLLRRVKWYEYAAQAGVGTLYCWVTNSCPGVRPWQRLPEWPAWEFPGPGDVFPSLK